MAMDDLFQSLRMLQQGATELQTSRAINGANQQVQQIKSSEASDADKRQQLTALSNQLVSHLGALGTPVDQIQQQVKAVAPVQYTNGMDMYRNGILNNDHGLQQQGLQVQKQEEQPEMDKLDKQLKIMAPFRKMMFDEKHNEFVTKQFDAFGKDLDQTEATSKNAFGQGAKALQLAGRIQQVAGDPSQWKNIPVGDMPLIIDGVLQLNKGGVGSKEEFDKMFPNTSGPLKARAEQFISNNPEPAQLQNFAAHYMTLLDRERQENEIQAQDTILKRAALRLRIHDLDPQQYKTTVAANLTQAGMPTSPDSIIVDKRRGRVTTAGMMQNDADTALALDALKKAYQNPKDPKSAQVFQTLGVPGSMPMSQASALVKSNVRRGKYTLNQVN